MDTRPILIIGAMNSEINYLIEKLEKTKIDKLNVYNIYEGYISNYPVIILKSEIGTINVAISTTLVIEKYNPIAVINCGTAGGFGNKIHRNDLVIGEKVFNITSAKTSIAEEGKGSNSINWDYITFIDNQEDRKMLKNADEKLMNIVKEIKKEYVVGKIYFGVIGSGDIWNREIDKIKFLNEKHDVLCEEMEAISIYTVANQYNISVIGIKVISDNEMLDEEYDKNLTVECQKFIIKFVEKLAQNIINKKNKE